MFHENVFMLLLLIVIIYYKYMYNDDSLIIHVCYSKAYFT